MLSSKFLNLDKHNQSYDYETRKAILKDISSFTHKSLVLMYCLNDMKFFRYF